MISGSRVFAALPSMVRMLFSADMGCSFWVLIDGELWYRFLAAAGVVLQHVDMHPSAGYLGSIPG